jgi:hypothetical protein
MGKLIIQRVYTEHNARKLGNNGSPRFPSLAFSAQQSVHRTAGGLCVLGLIQSRSLVPFRELVLPAAGNAGRWAVMARYTNKS